MYRLRMAVLGSTLGVSLLAGGLLFGGHSASADPGNGNNCVGAAVSAAAQDLGGLGQLNQAGINPGQAIQQFATDVCGKH